MDPNMFMFLFLLIVCQGVCQGATSHSAGLLLEENCADSNVSLAFESWIQQYGRVYSNIEEKKKRFTIFKKTYNFIENSKKDGKKKLYTLGLNDFADKTTEEITSCTTCRPRRGSRPITRPQKQISPRDFNKIHPEAVAVCGDYNDWSAYMSPARRQGNCESCTAMAVAATVEAINRIKFRVEVPPLSVQQILDCQIEGNSHCAGGFEDDAFEYVLNNRGLTSEEVYPYTAKDGHCDIDRESQVYADIDGYYNLSPSQSNIRGILCERPMTANIAFDLNEVYNYKGGIYNGPCGEKTDHVVVIVGVGRAEDGTEYWNLLNSWGPEWGENGYMRLIKDNTVQGHCRIAEEIYFAYLN